ncbi:serine hydrolase domain-containing protein [Phaeodactylibacter sp.]|jgi:CubicO group peptidase (beta-lactamase class C family)|uniref:serine hydrolase domain-containing protein n=1 Tax=Phaeodactylibacter sp. TaxID=1940289 RepID=UPI0025F39235|nr:serine hydrolase domain-containing protein [Phaeodactylibacter sp.]MCI4647968.1 beta-lactamase family protein [Phaeodactylibacter sp.]
MKMKVLIFLLFTAVVSSSGQEFDPDQRLVELTGKKENIGITAAYSVNGSTRWSNSSGWSCQDSESPFTATTLTRIASIAKNFTAVAIMQLVEKERISLSAPIETYLPDLPKDKKQITVLQLLAHTSGMPQYLGEEEIENTVHYNTLQDAMQVFIQRPLLFDPGEKYFYTTYGYVVLGRIIEAVTAMPYAEYMDQYIFEPAGMEHTYVEDIKKEYPGKSCLYHNNGRRARAGKQNDLSNRVPGGGYLSTLEDVMKFGNALLEGKLIAQKSLDQMLEVQPVEYDGNKYGLGWFLYGPPPNENLVIGHSGGQTGCTSQLMIIPKSQTVIVVLSNTSGNYPDIATFAIDLTAYSEKK